MRIRVVVPHPDARRDLGARVRRLDVNELRSGTQLELSATRNGPRSLGSPYDHTLAELVTLDAGMGAQDAGFDALCIDDVSDPALDALRSRLDIPVTAAGSAALWMGRLVGLPVAYIVPDKETEALHDLLGGLDEGTALAVPFSTSDDSPVGRLENVIEASRSAARGGAASLALVGIAEAYGAEVSSRIGLPAFGATMAAIKLAEVLVGLGLGPSRVAYTVAKQVQDELLRDRVRSAGGIAASPLAKPAGSPAVRRIKVIVPHSDMDETAVGRRADVIVPGLLDESTRVEYVGIRTSPNRADSPYATLLMDVFCFEEGLHAAEDGFHAVTVDSTTDSGIRGLRSRLPILVLGTGQASWALAAALCSRFSILAMEPEWAYFYRKNLKAARLAHALASVRVVGTPTDPYRLFEGKEAEMYRALTELGTSAIEEDGAEAIIVGSTTMHQAGDHLSSALPVPVLNPGRVALRSLEAMLEMGLKQSRVVWPPPAEPNDEVFA